jgi:gamma-glutamyltranspeptidase/glutathione hydrolase
MLLAMNVLEGFDLRALTDLERAHVLAETCKLMFIDMDDYFGDPNVVDVPVERLLSKAFASGRRQQIRHDSVLPWNTPGGLFEDSPNTTHFNVVDSAGNIAAITQTRSEWGIKRPIGETGLFLHNGLRLLSQDPSSPMYAGRPGMRIQKSMTPVIVRDSGATVLVLGAAGVRRITQAIVQVAVNHLDLGMNAQEAIDAPRLSYANRFEPLTVSPHYAPRIIQGLTRLGHQLTTGTSARVQAIAIDPRRGRLDGGADVFGKAAALV